MIDDQRLKALLRLCFCGTIRQQREAYQSILDEYEFPFIMRAGLELYCEGDMSEDLLILLKKTAQDHCENILKKNRELT